MSPMFLVQRGRVIFKPRRVSNGGKKGRAKKVCAQSGPKTERGKEIGAPEVGGAKINAKSRAQSRAQIDAQIDIAAHHRKEIG
jgi:hypothetical protein